MQAVEYGKTTLTTCQQLIRPEGLELAEVLDAAEKKLGYRPRCNTDPKADPNLPMSER